MMLPENDSDNEGLIVLPNSAPSCDPIPLPLPLFPSDDTTEQQQQQAPTGAGTAALDDLAQAAVQQPEVIMDDAVASKLFPKTVNSTYFNLLKVVKRTLEATVNDLSNQDLLAEISNNNDTVAACAVRVSNFATMLDKLWALYDQEHRALCLWSSRGLPSAAVSAGARVSGAAAFGFLIPTESPARASVNKPNGKPAPTSVSAPPPRPPLHETKLDEVVDWREDHEGEIEDGSSGRPSYMVVTFDTQYEILVEAAKQMLLHGLLAQRSPGVVGTRGVGHQLAMALYNIAEDLVSVLKRIGETRSNQRRMWVAYVAHNTHRNDKAQRTGEKGFVRLPPV